VLPERYRREALFLRGAAAVVLVAVATSRADKSPPGERTK